MHYKYQKSILLIMISSITLENFKCFKEATTFPFSKINLLTGINGRGKSTVLQSMLLFKQSVEEDKYTNSFYLNGDAIDSKTLNIGTFQDLKNFKSEKKSSSIKFNFDNDLVLKYSFVANLADKNKAKNLQLSIYLDIHKFKDFLLLVYVLSNTAKDYTLYYDVKTGNDIDPNYKFNFDALPKLEIGLELINLLPGNSLLLNIPEEVTKHLNFSQLNDSLTEISRQKIYENIQYISADRIGSQLTYKPKALRASGTISSNGDNVASIISAKKNEGVFPTLIKNNKVKADVLNQIGAWLSYIFDSNIELKINDKLDEVILLYFIVNGVRCKPTNVGFGYSYLLPILVAGLTATNKHTIIIENPEAHLHTRAQARLTEFLSKIADCGVQIFIESHSEHILNALQLIVKQDNINIKNTDVSVLYFQDTAEGEPSCVPIPITEQGHIELWPDGFFDQSEKSLKELYGI